MVDKMSITTYGIFNVINTGNNVDQKTEPRGIAIFKLSKVA